ncbi:MAG: sigma-70 family RNA polymerase sigma factor, partial [Acidimicrobiales bacterium]
TSGSVLSRPGPARAPRQRGRRETGRATEPDLLRLYLDGIGRYPLLSKDEEVSLAKLIETGRAAAAELSTGEAIPAERAVELRRAARRGLAAKNEFVNANLRLVVSIAKKYQTAALPLVDVIQEGNLGLMHAVDKFDWRKGFKFSTYATWWIRQAIGRGIDQTARTIRLPAHAGEQVRRVLGACAELEGAIGHVPTASELSEHLRMQEPLVAAFLRCTAEPVSLATPVGSDGESELGDIVHDASAANPFDVVAQRMLKTEVDKVLSVLDSRESQVLKLRFGLDRGEPRTLEEVGARFDLPAERVRHIEAVAMAKLRHPAAGSAARELVLS